MENYIKFLDLVEDTSEELKSLNKETFVFDNEGFLAKRKDVFNKGDTSFKITNIKQLISLYEENVTKKDVYLRKKSREKLTKEIKENTYLTKIFKVIICEDGEVKKDIIPLHVFYNFKLSESVFSKTIRDEILYGDNQYYRTIADNIVGVKIPFKKYKNNIITPNIFSYVF